ncbi:transposase [Streptomyces cadmiisoli]|uniref:transposase n=1 Tax=Streptomyces cadmiisoli TaxID=2184053 RepID=UPI0036663899
MHRWRKRPHPGRETGRGPRDRADHRSDRPRRDRRGHEPLPTPEHLVSWAKLCPRTIQSGARNTAGPAGHGNPWLKGALGEAANAAARTDTFLGACYRRIVKRRGHAKALDAVARSMLVIT